MKGEGGPQIIENRKISLYFQSLGRVVKGADAPIIIENTKISLYLHGLGGVVKARVIPKSLKIQSFLRIFMVWAAW